MGQSTPLNVGSYDASTAVAEVLSKHRKGAVISTADALRRVRELYPESAHTDKEITNLIVMAATGRNMAIHFDQI